MRRVDDGWFITDDEYEMLRQIALGQPCRPDDGHNNKFILIDNPAYVRWKC